MSADPDDDRRDEPADFYELTAAQIAEATALIRAGGTIHDERRRRVMARRHWEPPTIDARALDA